MRGSLAGFYTILNEHPGVYSLDSLSIFCCSSPLSTHLHRHEDNHPSIRLELRKLPNLRAIPHPLKNLMKFLFRAKRGEIFLRFLACLTISCAGG